MPLIAEDLHLACSLCVACLVVFPAKEQAFVPRMQTPVHLAGPPLAAAQPGLCHNSCLCWPDVAALWSYLVFELLFPLLESRSRAC